MHSDRSLGGLEDAVVKQKLARSFVNNEFKILSLRCGRGCVIGRAYVSEAKTMIVWRDPGNLG